MSLVVAVYCDGGLIGASPSRIAGTWAFCFVDRYGTRVLERSGVILPSEIGVEVVTANHAEFLAVTNALGALPLGWSGKVYTDSALTITRFSGSCALRNVPASWIKSAAEYRKRLGALTFSHVNGHPTRKQLATNVGHSGDPVSIHNVYVDRLCREAGERYKLVLKQREIATQRA